MRSAAKTFAMGFEIVAAFCFVRLNLRRDLVFDPLTLAQVASGSAAQLTRTCHGPLQGRKPGLFVGHLPAQKIH
jgi:hypothetical protein